MTSQPQEDDAETTVWVRSDRAVDGTYIPTLELDDDTSIPLTRGLAFKHVECVLDAVARAEYDAAVFAQFTGKLGIDKDHAADALGELRAARRAQRFPEAIPMRLIPGVSQRTSEPFLTVEIHGRKVGQWDMADARGHAMGVLMAMAVAPLDTAYRITLTGVLGLDQARAEQVVDDLANFRTTD